MQVLVNFEDFIEGDAELVARVEGVLMGTLEGYQDDITRIDVYLSDRNSYRFGDRDKRCRLEARMDGAAPIIVGYEAPLLTEAFHASVDKLSRALRQTLGRRNAVRLKTKLPSSLPA